MKVLRRVTAKALLKAIPEVLLKAIPKVPLKAIPKVPLKAIPKALQMRKKLLPSLLFSWCRIDVSLIWNVLPLIQFIIRDF